MAAKENGYLSEGSQRPVEQDPSSQSDDRRSMSNGLASHIKQLLRSSQGEAVSSNRARISPSRGRNEFDAPEFDDNQKERASKIAMNIDHLNNIREFQSRVAASPPKNLQSTAFQARQQLLTQESSNIESIVASVSVPKLNARHSAQSDLKSHLLLPTLQQINAIRAELMERNELLSNELQRTISEYDLLKNEIRKAEKGLSEAENQVRAETKQRLQLEREVAILSRREMEKDLEVQDLSKAAATLRAQLDIVQNNLLVCRTDAWEAAQSALDLERTQMQAEKSRSRQEIERLESQNAQLMDQLSRIDAKMGRFRQQVADEAQNAETWEAKANSLEVKLSCLMEELHSATNFLSENESTIRAKQDEILMLKDQDGKARQQLIQAAKLAEQKAKEFEAEWKHASRVCSELQGVNAEILTKLARSEGQNASLERELTSAIEQLKRTAEEKEKADNEYSESEILREKQLEEQMDLYNIHTSLYMSKLREITEQQDEFEERARPLEAKIHALQKDLDDATVRLAVHQTSISELTQERDILAHKLMSQSLLCEQYAVELEGKRVSEENLRQQLVKAVKEGSVNLHDKDQEIDHITLLLSRETEKGRSLERHIANLEEENTLLQDQLSEHRVKINEMHEKLKSSEAEITSVKIARAQSLQLTQENDREVDLLQKEKDRMSQELTKRSKVESDLRKELFHVMAELSRAKENAQDQDRMTQFGNSSSNLPRIYENIQTDQHLFGDNSHLAKFNEDQAIVIDSSAGRLSIQTSSPEKEQDNALLYCSHRDSSWESTLLHGSHSPPTAAPNKHSSPPTITSEPINQLPHLSASQPQQGIITRKRSIVVGISKKWVQHSA